MGQVTAMPESLHLGSGGVHNYEKAASVTDNEPLIKIGQTIEDGNINRKKQCAKQEVNYD